MRKSGRVSTQTKCLCPLVLWGTEVSLFETTYEIHFETQCLAVSKFMKNERKFWETKFLEKTPNIVGMSGERCFLFLIRFDMFRSEQRHEEFM